MDGGGRLPPFFFSLPMPTARFQFGHLLLFLTTFAVAFAAVPVKKAPAKKGPVKKAAPGKSTKAAPKAVAGKKGTKAGTRPGQKASGYRSRQLQPTKERYQEIQRALADRGYLKSEPNGVWDADSMAALKQFQTEQNLSPTGKLSSQSLIALGLGPKTAGPLVMPAAGGAGESPPGLAGRP